MSNNDFLINNNRLEKYVGIEPNASVVVPDGVKIIGQRAFFWLTYRESDHSQQR